MTEGEAGFDRHIGERGAHLSSGQRRILALARHWRAVWVVVDATGVGAGLAGLVRPEFLVMVPLAGLIYVWFYLGGL